jgi:uncharacterized membrane protein
MNTPADPTGHTAHGLSDHEVEQLIGRLLQIGVAISAIVILIGGVLLVMHRGSEIPSYAVFGAEPAQFRSIGGIVHGLAALRGDAITQFGLLLLILTPIMRVALTWIAFVIQRDGLYVLVTSIVLVLLVYGLVIGTA